MFRSLNMPVVAACAALLAPCAVNAATVSSQSGTVFVNKGDGFVRVIADSELPPGGQVMVEPGGVALITYASNCAVRVGSGRVWVVQAAPPCAEGAGMVDFTGRMNQQAPPQPGIDPPTLLIGGVIIAGAVAIAVLASQDDSPASP